MSLSERRVVSLVPATATVISNMVGTGIFTTTGLMLATGAGSGDVLMAWWLGGLIALLGALCYGELGANMPASGGEYYYLSRLFHPVLGFLAGWVSLIAGFSAPIAASAIAMHMYMARVIPGWPVRFGAVVTIGVLSALHAYDIRLGAGVQTALTVLKVGLLVGFVFVAFAQPGFSIIPILQDTQPSFWLSPAFAVLLVFASFAYSGWNAAAYIGAEICHPSRNLPAALVLGTVTVTGLYILVNAAYMGTTPVTRLIGVEEVAHVVGHTLWGPGGSAVVSIMIALALVSTTSAMIFVGPRVYEAMARDGLFPILFGHLNARGVPSYAVLLQAVLAILFALTAAFGPLLIYIGYTLNVFAMFTVLGVFPLRRRGLARHRICGRRPWAVLVFAAFALWMTVWSISARPIVALSGLGTLATGLIVYTVWKRQRSVVSRQ